MKIPISPRSRFAGNRSLGTAWIQSDQRRRRLGRCCGNSEHDACAVGGPCAVAGRTPNTSTVKDGYMRQIIITDIDDPERPVASNYPIARRRVEVHVRYFANQIAMEEVASTILIQNYRTSQWQEVVEMTTIRKIKR